MINYLSLCSGIEAASVAWEQLRWNPVAFAEIDPFPSAVLTYHYPEVPNLGDMTAIKSEDFRNKVNLIIGGTPCQSYSVAGQRKGLDDERGALSLHYARLINEIKPKYFIWENVPGVLSDKGNAYGHFLSKLVGEELPLEPTGGKWASAGWVNSENWSLAWRILDSQFFGVPQRRRRVFLVGCLREVGDAREILFESESLSGYIKASREKRKANTSEAPRSFDSPSGYSGHEPRDLGRSLDSKFVSHWEGGDVHPTLCISGGHGGPGISNQDVFGQKGSCLVSQEIHAEGFNNTGHSSYKGENVSGTLRASGGDLSGGSECLLVYENHGTDSRLKEVTVNPTVTARYGTGGNNVPLVQTLYERNGPMPREEKNVAPTLLSSIAKHDTLPLVHNCIQANTIREKITSGGNGKGWNDGDISYTLTTNDIHAVCTEEAYPLDMRAIERDDNSSNWGLNLDKNAPHYTVTAQKIHGVFHRKTVRRLTPTECERLQGFPDNWTLIPYNGKPASDTPRYKAIGNSMAVCVITWLGERIQANEDMLNDKWGDL